MAGDAKVSVDHQNDFVRVLEERKAFHAVELQTGRIDGDTGCGGCGQQVRVRTALRMKIPPEPLSVEQEE